jgi:drug/metabolite transporter (DMT)-like permease
LSTTRSRLVLALAAVYVIWGSTYLAIHFALATLPGFTMAGVRFLIAGGVLYFLARGRGAGSPRPIEWRSAAIVGFCLLGGGNGGVVWAQHTVPSGIAALLVATMPLFMAAMAGLGGTKLPRGTAAVGLLIGFAGVAVLIGPGISAGGKEHIAPWGVAALLFACVSWAGGSLYSRRAPLPKSALLATGMEMLAGGALLLVVGGIAGEWRSIDLAAVSWRSWLAFAYLITFGSLIGFTAYIWLLRNTTTSLASTYAYVNPLVAVFLGWLLADEALSGRIGLAALLIVISVVLITRAPREAPVKVSSGGLPEPDRQA